MAEARLKQSQRGGKGRALSWEEFKEKFPDLSKTILDEQGAAFKALFKELPELKRSYSVVDIPEGEAYMPSVEYPCKANHDLKGAFNYYNQLKQWGNDE